jgi:hypothetical protein
MAINIAQLTPASLKAKEVATQEYVDNSVPEGMVTETEVTTIIGNTTLDGNKITTGYLSADRIAAGIIYDDTHYNWNPDGTVNAELGANTYKMKIDLSAGSIHIK